METYVEGSRIGPEDWIPLLLNVYDTLSSIVQEFGVWITVVGAGAYAIHVEPDPTKDIDFVLSKPLSIDRLAYLLNRLRQHLEQQGYHIIGSRIQLGRSYDDWVIQLFVVLRPGKIVGIEVFNLLAVRPLSLYRTERVLFRGREVNVITIESWIASKLADPNGIDERNLKRLEKAIDIGIDEYILLDIIMKLSLQEIIRINSRDALSRTQHSKLKKLLMLLI